MDENKTLFAGELQLMAWGDSSTTGPWVKFWCHPDDLEQFKLFRQRKGNKEAGTRLGVVMVEINNEEAVVTQPDKPKDYRVKVGQIAMMAVAYCRNPDFQRWAAGLAWVSPQSAKPLTEAECKAFILERTGITAKYGEAASRKHLDSDGEAAIAFEKKIRQPYVAWLAQEV